MQIKNSSKLMSAALLSLLLAACGGGANSPLDGVNSSSKSSSSSSSAANSTATSNGTSSVALSSVDSTTPEKLGYGFDTTFAEGVIGVGIGSSDLSAGGSTALIVNVVSSTNTLVTAATVITFNSTCFANDEAIFTNSTGVNTTVVTTSNGQASINYKANGCVGSDRVTATASINGTVKSAQVLLNVQQDTVQSITFQSATPELISLKGTGGTETSLVRFVVTGSAGAPVKGVTVSMTLNTTEGGLCLVDPANNSTCATTVTGTSDKNGVVAVTVQAGTKPTPVRVTATATGTSAATQSNVLLVSTGIPDQNSMSLSTSLFNPSGWNHDGEEVTLTIRLADAFNNPPPNGTAVSFTTEGGSIDPGCTTTNGACSVIWRSQNPRPSNGRVTIQATAIGNESFIDDNSNGVYDSGTDTFITTGNCDLNAPVSSAVTTDPDIACDDLPEAYLDKNENGVRDSGEEYVDYNLNGSHTPANGIYNGVLCATEGSGCTKTGVTVRDDIVITMSGDIPATLGGLLLGQPANVTLGAGQTTSFVVTLQDENGNAMPQGTKIAINSANASNVTVNQNFPSSGVPNSTGISYFTVTMKAADDKVPSGSFDIQIQAPKLTTTFSTSLN